MIDRKARLLALSIWIGLITIVSLSPLRVKNFLGSTGPWHRQIHVSAFLVTGLLVIGDRRRNFTRFTWLVLYGATLELLESALYGNGFEWRDLFADSMGIFLACVLAAIRNRETVP
jgi:hypothetical protein